MEYQFYIGCAGLYACAIFIYYCCKQAHKEWQIMKSVESERTDFVKTNSPAPPALLPETIALGEFMSLAEENWTTGIINGIESLVCKNGLAVQQNGEVLHLPAGRVFNWTPLSIFRPDALYLRTQYREARIKIEQRLLKDMIPAKEQAHA